MKNAKELFKELGYACYKSKYEIRYEKRWGTYGAIRTTLVFNTLTGSLKAYEELNEPSNYRMVVLIKEELDAVYQQLKEIEENNENGKLV